MPVSCGGHRRYDPNLLKEVFKDRLDEEDDEMFTKEQRAVVKLKQLKQKPLTIKQITDTCKVLDRALIPYAIIGGGAFMLHGMDYQTYDIDISAYEKISPAMESLLKLEKMTGPGVGTDKNGHYKINGIKVDWMYRLEDGSGRLFKKAIDDACSVQRLPVATMTDSMAIKVNAGRQKDVAVFYNFITQGYVDARAVLLTVDEYVDA